MCPSHYITEDTITGDINFDHMANLLSSTRFIHCKVGTSLFVINIMETTHDKKYYRKQDGDMSKGHRRKHEGPPWTKPGTI